MCACLTLGQGHEKKLKEIFKKLKKKIQLKKKGNFS